MLLEINFTKFKEQLVIKQLSGKRKIFDPLRRKYLVLTPEEFVRQLFVLYLIEEKNYNKNLIKIEKTLQVNQLTKRCDILIYNKAFQPVCIVECKAPHIKISADTFRQIATYNMPLQVKTLIVSNGIQTYCSIIDHENSNFEFSPEIPSFEDLKTV